MGLLDLKYKRWQKKLLIAKRQCHIHTMNLWDLEDTEGVVIKELIALDNKRKKWCDEETYLEKNPENFYKKHIAERGTNKESELSKRYHSPKTLDLDYDFLTDTYKE